MQKLTIFKFFIPLAIITSIFSGLVYNLLYFLNTQVFESHWSLYFDPGAFSFLMSLSFILFAVILIVSLRWIEKIFKEQFIIIGILLIGFCCIFASLLTVWEIVVLSFLIMSASIAFLIPMISKYTSDLVRERYQKRRYKLIFPISLLVWALISYILFTLFGVHWRFLYFATGIINIISSLAFVFI
ncbi:MAG: MFS transporter [Candidatus Hermodarchaeota archaeon]